MTGLVILLTVLTVVVLAYDIYKGEILLFQCIDNIWTDLVEVEITRYEKPLLFWLLVLIEAAVMLGLILKFK